MDHRCTGFVILLATLFAPHAIGFAEDRATDSRLDEVERRGSHVMPFRLDATRHVFTKTATGGRQQVVANDPADAGQIALVRRHLEKISEDFARGDFSDPARIHGEDMPGLAELRNAKPGTLDIEYRELENGAEIDYSAKDPALVTAIHRWFDAQLKDHARHAVPGHHHGH